MKYAQAIALPFAMIAAICGIYFIEKPPYTHIAAVAVVVGTGIAFVDALKTAKEKEYAEEMLTHLYGADIDRWINLPERLREVSQPLRWRRDSRVR